MGANKYLTKKRISSYKINTGDIMYSMINIMNTAVHYIWKLKAVIPKNSHHKEKYIFLFFCYFVSVSDDGSSLSLLW